MWSSGCLRHQECGLSEGWIAPDGSWKIRLESTQRDRDVLVNPGHIRRYLREPVVDGRRVEPDKVIEQRFGTRAGESLVGAQFVIEI